jgi:outer membrane lipoprotein-sorting protein
MNARVALAAIVIAVCLSACSKSNSDQAAAPQLFKQEKAALDKAKGVQQIVQQQAQQQRRQIEKATR